MGAWGGLQRQFLSEPEVPVFVQPRDVLRTLVCSCDVLVILGDDSKVVRELMRLRGAGATAVRLAASPKRSTASPFLGSTVKTVEEALEHVHQILSSNISADTARFTGPSPHMALAATVLLLLRPKPNTCLSHSRCRRRRC